MKRFLLVFLLMAPSLALAGPFVVSDPLIAGVSQCGIYVDSEPKITVPVTVVGGQNVCQWDAGNVSEGSHTVQMTAIAVNDPLWGSRESAKSAPFSFVRPSAPSAPAGLALRP